MTNDECLKAGNAPAHFRDDPQDAPPEMRSSSRGEHAASGAQEPGVRLTIHGQRHSLARAPLVMGIVNLSPDSFSGDGAADLEAALAHARRQLADGADIIDIGAESARTNRAAIEEEEEEARLLCFVERWNGVRGMPNVQRPTSNAQWPLLSINTWRPAVARAVLARGGDILNDIGGVPTEVTARTCAEAGAALLIMHTMGEPKVPHTHVRYDDVLAHLEAFFFDKLALAERAGLSREATILDPGIDFAKSGADGLRILLELERLHRFGRPILLPVSRKTVIGEVLGISDPAERDAGTIACVVQGMLRGAHIVRVHNVRAAVQAVRMIEAVV